jgi:hypothetical protein
VKKSSLSPQGGGGRLSPVLLLGAGHGEATCGILYLASYLRRHGVEAYVRLVDTDDTDAQVKSALAGLMTAVRPKLVGISLKWFNHVARGLKLARLIHQLDPEVRIVFGGNSASYWWEELAATFTGADIILGDGELPLLQLARGEAQVANRVTHRGGAPWRSPLSYVQSEATRDAHYSHFDELFLSQLDQSSFSGWVAPGKGCSENCVYCGGGRGMQQASFGRAESFLRPSQSVRRDHQEIAPRTWQLRYDFSGGTAEFLSSVWKGIDLSKHSTTYFLWGLPPPSLIDTLARTFGRVYMVLDVGCFSEGQRATLMKLGLLKPCPSDAELLDTVEACRRHANLTLEVCGIVGLPFATDRTLAQERGLVERLLERGVDVGSQRLESQPGALVTQHAQRFGMVSQARTFREFVEFFEQREHRTDGAFPMVRFGDRRLEGKVQRAADALHALAQHRASTRRRPVSGKTRLVSAVASRREVKLGDWLGAHRVPSRLFAEPVTVLRSPDGAGFACTPMLGPERFADASLQQGPAGAAVLAALEAFGRPATVDQAVSRLTRRCGLTAGDARELVQQLAAGRFVERI